MFEWNGIRGTELSNISRNKKHRPYKANSGEVVLRQPITLQRLPQGDTFEQIVSSVEGIIDYDGIMYAGCLCKLYLLYGSVQALADGLLSFRSASRETLMENRKARRCDEKIGGFYRRPLDKTYSLILLVNILKKKLVQEVVKKNIISRTCASMSRMGRRPVL